MERIIDSDEAMRAFGESIGTIVTGGECIELIGDIGSGKTTLTKGIAQGMGITDTIQSPTFTINRTYDSPSGLRLSHYDFYRLDDAGIMADELRETQQDTSTVIVIEWGSIVSDVLNGDRLSIEFQSPSETTRQIRMVANGTKTQRIIEELI